MSMSIRPVHACECVVCQQQTDEAVMRYHDQINRWLSRLAESQRRRYVSVLSQDPDSSSDTQLSLISGSIVG
jgi:hypothetical protein